MLELQKQETERSEEFRQRTEEHFKIVEDAQERIVQAVEMFVDQLIEADNESDGVAKAIDSQDVWKTAMLCSNRLTTSNDVVLFKRLISFSIFTQRSSSTGSLGFLLLSMCFTSLCAPRSCGKMEKTGRM